MPVVWCKALPIIENRVEKGIYECPVYKTEKRGTLGLVFMAQLKTTKYPAQKWIIAGVAIILDVQGISDAFVAGKDPNAVGDK